MTNEIEDKVMKMTQDNTSMLTAQSGVEPSLTDYEIRSYLDKVLEELVKGKRRQ
jgi:hypothetical protein